MSLTKDLLDVSLSHKCPSCGHSHQRSGKIFRAITHYVCEACGTDVRLTYPDKLALFQANAHRTT
jgi:transposase-like protein